MVGFSFFSGGESVLSRESKRRQEFSLYRGSQQTRKQCEERRSQIFCFLAATRPFSSKFLDKKRDTPREKEERNGERERFCILCWCFLLWECFSLFFFVRCVFFDVVCSLAALRVQKIVVLVLVVLHY